MFRTGLAALFVIVLLGFSASCRRSKVVPVPKAQSTAPAAESKLTGVEWQLVDLEGKSVRDHVPSTLAFPQPGRAAGSTGCNRFSGSVTIKGTDIKFGVLATTRRACVPGVGDQEKRYMKALSSAERFTFSDNQLLIFSRGIEKPLRFTPVSSNP